MTALDVPRQTIATRPTVPSPLDFDRAEKVASAMFKGGITGGAATRDGVLARIIAGHYLGLNETASVMGVMVNNGKPAIWGDAVIAKVRASGELVSYHEEISGEGDAQTATVTVVRAGHESTPTVRAFSVADAKKAGLWTKGGPWQQYPRRMLPTKPRAWALRDTFADVLMGIGIREEYEPPMDVPATVVTAALPVSPTPSPSALPVPGDQPGKVSVAMLQEIGAARVKWLEALEIDPADRAAVDREWQAKLFTFKVKTARDLTPELGAALLADLRSVTEFDPKKLEKESAAVFEGEGESSATVTVTA